MIPKEIIKKVRHIEIRTKGLVNDYLKTMSSIGVDIKGRLNLAIPQREMDINSSFTQNPGY